MQLILATVCVSPGTETEIMAQMRDKFRGLGRHKCETISKKRENHVVLMYKHGYLLLTCWFRSKANLAKIRLIIFRLCCSLGWMDCFPGHWKEASITTGTYLESSNKSHLRNHLQNTWTVGFYLEEAAETQSWHTREIDTQGSKANINFRIPSTMHQRLKSISSLILNLYQFHFQ